MVWFLQGSANAAMKDCEECGLAGGVLVRCRTGGIDSKLHMMRGCWWCTASDVVANGEPDVGGY